MHAPLLQSHPMPPPPNETGLSLYLIYQRRSNGSQTNAEVAAVFTSPLRVLLYIILFCISRTVFMVGRPHSLFCACIKIGWTNRENAKRLALVLKTISTVAWVRAGWWERMYLNDRCHLSRFQISLPKEVTVDMRLPPSESVKFLAFGLFLGTKFQDFFFFNITYPHHQEP